MALFFKGSGPNDSIQVPPDEWSPANGELVRKDLRALAIRPTILDMQAREGSPDSAADTWVDIPFPKQYELNGTDLAPFTAEAIYYSWVASGATSVQLRLVTLVGGAVDEVIDTSTSVSATTPQREVKTIFLASGENLYGLQIKRSNVDNPVIGYGQIRIGL